MKDIEHTKRIHQELRAAGMTSYGFTKLETKYLPALIHEDEHVKGVVYGRLDSGSGVDAVMLVATDKRVLYIDCKPFYKDWDGITYEVVAGVKMSIVGSFASIVLHTRVKEYSLRFVNIKCARIFTKYIERYIEQLDDVHKPSADKQVDNKIKTQAPYQPYRMEQKNEPVLGEEEIASEGMDDSAVLSTVDAQGNPHASVVHFEIDKDENFYILTKKDTQKAKNIMRHHEVALTIHHSHSLKVLYINGHADVVKDPEIFSVAYKQIAKINNYKEGKKLAPITKVNAGDYVVFKITPSASKFDDYSLENW